MPSSKLLNQINEVAGQAAARADEYSGVFGSVKAAIIEAFGPNGLIAAYVMLTVLVLLLATKLAKITFSTLIFVVIPAVALCRRPSARWFCFSRDKPNTMTWPSPESCPSLNLRNPA